MIRGLTDGAAPLATLEEETRRRIYLLVRARRAGVSRDEVATALGISRKLAAFHLEKLLAAGLLTARYARPPGRSGRGAGRTAKFYSLSDVEIEISLPERRYDLAGTLLVDAIQSEAPGESARDATLRVARERGVAMGSEVRNERRLRRPGPERTLAAAENVLGRHGFEPYREEPSVVALRNCPFHSLAKRAPELVCEMNRSFLEGVIRGMGNQSVEAVLSCKPGDCCVTLRAPGASPSAASERATSE